MSLDSYFEKQDENKCLQCGSTECGTCKYCKRKIISGISCVSCAKSGKELSGWWFNNVNHLGKFI